MQLLEFCFLNYQTNIPHGRECVPGCTSLRFELAPQVKNNPMISVNMKKNFENPYQMGTVMLFVHNLNSVG